MSRDPSPVGPDSVLVPGDAELVRNVLARRPEAIEALISRLACVPAMLRAKNVQLGGPLDARELDEVTQNALGALWSKLARYEGRSSLETWAFGFCVNEILKHLQQRRRPRALDIEGMREELVDEDDAGEPDVAPATIERSLSRLPAEASLVIRARHYEGISFEEIAEREDVPVNTVKARYYRGLTKLRDLLEPVWRRSML